MTRLDMLLSYTNERKRDTWATLGEASVPGTTKFFAQNSLFRLNSVTIPSTPLHGAIIFISDDITLPSSFSWANMEISNETNGDIIDITTSIISSHIHVILSSSAFDAITDPIDYTFIPFQEPNSTAFLTISPHNLEMILTEVGVPFITLEELEFSRDRIVNNMIYPAVREYYKFFPITSVGNYPLSNNTFSIPIPPDPIFTPIEARIIPGVPISGQGIQNPLTFFFDEVLMNVAGGANGGFSTPGYATSRRRGTQGMTNIATTVLERAVRSGIVNYAQRNRLRISIQEGKVTGYSTVKGTLQITWGAWNSTFEMIPFNRQSEVRQLSTAYALRALGMLRGQSNSTIPGTIKYDSFLNRAETLEKEILSFWRESTKATLVRLG